MLSRIICKSKNKKIHSNNQKFQKDILITLLMFFNKDDLCTAALVCKFWQETSSNNQIWRPLANSYLFKLGIFSNEKVRNIKNIKLHYAASIQLQQMKEKIQKLEKQINMKTESLFFHDKQNHYHSYCVEPYKELTGTSLDYSLQSSFNLAIDQLIKQKEDIIKGIKKKELSTLEFLMK